MATLPTFPELRGNYTAVPDLFFDTLLKSGLSREELEVTLFLIHKNYQFERTMTLVPLEAIVAGTDLDQVGALRGLRAALGRGTVLQFHTESPTNPANFYLLNTDENQRVMAPFLPDGGDIAEPPPGRETPIASSTGALAAAAELAADDEGPIAPPKPAPRPPAAPRPPVAAPAPPRQPSAPSPPAQPPTPARPPSGAAHRSALSPRAASRITEAVGRDLTKDERTRLEELGALETGLLEALQSLEKRQVEIYSSDLVIYEYESRRASERRAAEDNRRKAESDQAKSRQRACKKCNGLGYLFIGVNTVEECACRKAR
ncbi:MAG: hypothetical protein HY303_03265 [Candidatus Wallbacteria bacterium]|nr:hypothetical protein [Candidatus Wallbacteria bacterium]